MSEDRQHSRYAGPDRHTWLKTGERVHKGQRWFVVTPAYKPTTVTWTRGDQAWAVSMDFFVERVQPLNQARLVSLAKLRRGRLGLEANAEPETEAELCNRLLQSLFRNPSNQRLQRLFAFIEQQDHFGWSDTWETPSIEAASLPMRWLSAWHNDNRRGAQGTQGVGAFSQRAYDHLRADANRAGRAELGLETRELRRIYTAGCPCAYCKAQARTLMAEAA